MSWQVVNNYSGRRLIKLRLRHRSRAIVADVDRARGNAMSESLRPIVSCLDRTQEAGK